VAGLQLRERRAHCGGHWAGLGRGRQRAAGGSHHGDVQTWIRYTTILCSTHCSTVQCYCSSVTVLFPRVLHWPVLSCRLQVWQLTPGWCLLVCAGACCCGVQVPMDAQLWQLIAYCAGTGGSILIIGSAAGVAFMGMEKADFFWYLKQGTAIATPKPLYGHERGGVHWA